MFQRNAVVVTHGWNSDAADWVKAIAKGICANIGVGLSFDAVGENGLSRICTREGSDGWDVYVWDWRLEAATNLPEAAYHNTVNEAEKLGNWLGPKSYQHIHLIAHSAGSSLIDQVTDILKDSATIHTTFLDAYHPDGNGSVYGKDAAWADNYVDTRPVSVPDHTDMYIENAYNVDVTGSDSAICEAVCRHTLLRCIYGLR